MRSFNKRQKLILAMVAGGKCQICGEKLTKQFHADHKQAWSKGGKTLTTNGQALCQKCNLQKGNK